MSKRLTQIVFLAIVVVVAFTAGLSTSHASPPAGPTECAIPASALKDLPPGSPRPLMYVRNGGSLTMFYVKSPRTDIGPNYTCAEVSRVRQCVNGKFSEETPVCSQYDSGGCVDSWLQQLNDKDFTFFTCED